MRRKVADGHCRKCWIHQSEAMYGKAGDTEWGGSSVSLIMDRLAGSRFQTTESDSASLWQVRSEAFSVEKRCDTLRSERIIQLTPCISPPSVGRCLCGMKLSSLSAPPLARFRVGVMTHCLARIIPLSHAAMWTEIREGDCAGGETREGASVSAGNWCQGEPCPPRLDDDMWRSVRARPLCAISCRCIPRQRGIPRQDSCGRARDSLARRYISGRDGSGDARGCQRMPRS